MEQTISSVLFGSTAIMQIKSLHIQILTYPLFKDVYSGKE